MIVMEGMTVWPLVPTGSEIKKDCIGEGQQKITGVFCCVLSLLRKNCAGNLTRMTH
jgi:hypothetical protein